MCDFLGHPFRKPQHNGPGERRPVAPLAEIAKAFLREANLAHAGVEHGVDERLIDLDVQSATRASVCQ